MIDLNRLAWVILEWNEYRMRLPAKPAWRRELFKSRNQGLIDGLALHANVLIDKLPQDFIFKTNYIRPSKPPIPGIPPIPGMPPIPGIGGALFLLGSGLSVIIAEMVINIPATDAA